ncbi:MAG: YjbQ family protein [Planctomycetes bacterium]|nr:YjbQ family protein [Planctomycetota bacterium]
MARRAARAVRARRHRRAAARGQRGALWPVGRRSRPRPAFGGGAARAPADPVEPLAGAAGVTTSRLDVATRGRGLVDITRDVARAVAAAGVTDGLATLFVQHTSASLIVQENADPDVQVDLEAFLRRLVPDGDPLWTHTAEGPDDMPAHVRAALTQVSLSIPVVDGRLALGTWQGIYLWEHRRRGSSRRVLVHVGENEGSAPRACSPAPVQGALHRPVPVSSANHDRAADDRSVPAAGSRAEARREAGQAGRDARRAELPGGLGRPHRQGEAEGLRQAVEGQAVDGRAQATARRARAGAEQTAGQAAGQGGRDRRVGGDPQARGRPAADAAAGRARSGAAEAARRRQGHRQRSGAGGADPRRRQGVLHGEAVAGARRGVRVRLRARARAGARGDPRPRRAAQGGAGGAAAAAQLRRAVAEGRQRRRQPAGGVLEGALALVVGVAPQGQGSAVRDHRPAVRRRRRGQGLARQEPAAEVRPGRRRRQGQEAALNVRRGAARCAAIRCGCSGRRSLRPTARGSACRSGRRR